MKFDSERRKGEAAFVTSVFLTRTIPEDFTSDWKREPPDSLLELETPEIGPIGLRISDNGPFCDRVSAPF